MQHDGLACARLLRPTLLGAACLLLLGACSSGVDPRDPVTGLPATGQLKLQLTRADSCGDLLARVQDGLIAPLQARAQQLRNPANASAGGGYYYPGASGGSAGSGGTLAGSAPPRASAPVPMTASADGAGHDNVASPEGSAPTSGTASGNAGSATPGPDPSAPAPDVPVSVPGTGKEASGGFSGTTVQVKDVDEADIVKTEGDQIYLLHGGTLFVLRGWPANDTSILGSASVEGQPSEMFVRDGKALVFSALYGDLGANAVGSAAPQPYASGSYTKLTVFDVSGDTPALLRESYVEGDYVSARRHDGLVRAVVQDGFKVPQLGNPYIEYVDAFGQPFPQADIDAQVDDWLERTVRSVRSTDIGDWLPREFSKRDGQLVAEAPRCADYYSPDPGLTESGVTSVVSLDLDDVAAPLGGATILGRAERVYSNEDVVLVTQSDYRYRIDQGASEQTIVHRFDIAGKQTSYVASGAVPGTIQNQFSLDEANGVIRVSTTEQRFGQIQPGNPIALDQGTAGSASTSDGKVAPIAPQPLPSTGPTNRVVTLGTEGNSLVQLGATSDFGAGESIYGTRFIGDRGYVVTFRQTDPLFVIDLSDPKDPSVVGELRIPGFSNYLFPLDDSHLFAIGQDATANGQVQGLALQIFDVSDASNPTLSQRYVYADHGASPANVDQRAISFHPNGSVVAFPYQKWDTGESTLEVFRLSAAGGFTHLGGMGEPIDIAQCLVRYGFAPNQIATIQDNPESAAPYEGYCRGYQYFRRGLFRDDFVYGISNTNVSAYTLDALAGGAIASVSLPSETYAYGGYAGSGMTSGYGGEANVPPPSQPTPPVISGGGGASGSGDPVAPVPDEPSPKPAAE